MWWAKVLHRFFEEFQCRFAITTHGDIAFQHFTFVIYGPSQVVGFTVDLHKNLVLMPLAIRMSTKVLNLFSSNLRGEQRPKAIPPKSYGLMANINTALMQQVFHIPE